MTMEVQEQQQQHANSLPTQDEADAMKTVEENNSNGFEKSLQELKDLKSQLHYAAEYCETTFKNAKHKRNVVENTKEYLCRAVITVVDHLGCVSANIDGLLIENNTLSKAELQLNCLSQRLLLCQQYAHKIALNRLRWNPHLPRYNPHYRAQQTLNLEKPNGDSSVSDKLDAKKKTNEDDACEVEEEDTLLFWYPSRNMNPLPIQKLLAPRNGSKNGKTYSLSVMSVPDGVSTSPRVSNPTFHFQETQKAGHDKVIRASYSAGKDIVSFIRRRRRTSTNTLGSNVHLQT